MSLKKLFLSIIFVSILCINFVAASDEQVLVEMREYVNQNVTYNPLKATQGIWADNHENQSYYQIYGHLIIFNKNPNGKTISDIYVTLDNTSEITLPIHLTGRNGTFLSNDTSSGKILLHIPELRTGENASFLYYVNTTDIRPPLNFSSNYSNSKVLAGENITVTDKIENVFDNALFQTNTCIYDINITQVTVPVNFSDTWQDYFFFPTSLTGQDSANVTFSLDNKTLKWDVFAGNCLNKSNSTSITYNVDTPLNVPETNHYRMINSTIRYKLNNTISHLRLFDIKAISEASINFSKEILGPANELLYGSNVTWNVSSSFETATQINYNLTKVTLWVSKRDVNGSFTDPNTIDNDTISGAALLNVMTPNTIVNISSGWTSDDWLFNYTDLPTPIVWMKINFTIANDGVQLLDRSITQNDEDLYIKELYLVVGYWLEIEKNITSVGENLYHVKIDVHNRGNRLTPKDAVVTIYDFVPSSYNVTGDMIFSSSPWYLTDESNNTVEGNDFNGTLFQWGLIPQNSFNTSFAEGPQKNENTTWSVDYNVTGFGDYKLMDVFVTGLDPQSVDGAGSIKAISYEETLSEEKSSPEFMYAGFAALLMLLFVLI